jgi:hypothetical protein
MMSEASSVKQEEGSGPSTKEPVKEERPEKVSRKSPNLFLKDLSPKECVKYAIVHYQLKLTGARLIDSFRGPEVTILIGEKGSHITCPKTSSATTLHTSTPFSIADSRSPRRKCFP